MISLDGSAGEGGGQVLRTALSLSACTGEPFAIRGIRARRRKPGLMRQHLTAVLAAAEVCGADVDGAEVGSTELVFRPGSAPRAGHYAFSIGTAGSTTLVLQTVLPPLLGADAPSTVQITGGTHNPMAPPFEFLARCFAPQLRRCGVGLDLELHRAGFHPAGGGQLVATIRPGSLRPISLLERGALVRRIATARVANLSNDIAARELAVVRKRLEFRESELRTEPIYNATGPGNALTIEHEFEHVTEIATSFGERGIRAEQVAKNAVRDARTYLASDAPVGEHLADQLLIPLALAGGGELRTLEPSLHTRTNCDVIACFLPVQFELRDEGERSWTVSVA